MFITKRTMVAAVIALSLSACGESVNDTDTQTTALSAEDARAFLTNAENEIAKIQIPAAHAEWSYATNINFDTAALSSYFNEVLSTKVAELAKQAAQFNDVEVDADTRRQLDLLKMVLLYHHHPILKKLSDWHKLALN